MTTRKADFRVSTAAHTGFKELGYYDDVQAICVLNQSILVFTVRVTKLIFCKPKYMLNIVLPSILTGRKYGIAYFETLEDAIECGTQFIKQRFPLATEQDLLED